MQERPAGPDPDETVVPESVRPGVPDSIPEKIGAYRILALIGEGGMGAVYEAEQDSPRRKVALKVIKPGLFSEEMLRRFELESEVLGRLQHPGIAQIHQAGTAATSHGPQPYFAMERVEGETLSVHAAAYDPTLEQRLELVARICDAVQHAHQKGVIHRDLKPGNILVTKSGDPKILDFGVARVTDAEAQATMLTHAGQIVGTVSYMSPEGVSGDDEVDTRSDVYALGVILYELLAGHPPYELGQKALPDVLLTIRDADPRPISTWNPNLRGDVETIVAKALEKEKENRYASAAELAADLRRYLRDEPIYAQPHGTSYYLRRFARRNKTLVGGVVAVILALGAGAVVSSIQAQRATREARKAAAVNTFLQEMLAAASPMNLSVEDPVGGRDVTVLQVATEASQRLRNSALEDQPLVEGAIRRTLGDTFRDLGDYDNAEANLRRSLELRTAELGEEHDEVAESLDSLGELLHDQGKLDEAQAALEQALAMRTRLLGASHVTTAGTQRNLADLLRDKREDAKAIQLYRQALAIQRAELGSEHPETAQTISNLAISLRHEGELDEAQSLFAEALATRRKTLGHEHPDVARTLHDLALLRKTQGKWAEAEDATRESVAIWEKLLGSDHQYLASSLINLGVMIKNQGRLSEAEPLYERAIGIMRASLGNESPTLAGGLYNFGKLLQAQGKAREAEPHAREALLILRKVLPPRHASLAGVQSGLASMLTDLGRGEQAESLLREALSIYDEVVPGKWQGKQVRSLLGAALMSQSRFSEAEPFLLEGFEGLKDDPAVSADRKHQAAKRLVQLYEQWSKTERDSGLDAKAMEWRSILTSQDRS